jgi:SnoaL-like domain
MSTATSTLAGTIDTYLAAWTEADPARRAALIAQVWDPTGSLTDPPMAAEGHDAISQMMAAFQGQFPGQRFRRASGVDAHHDRFRFAWELVAPDGSVTLAGLDVGELAEDGRLRRITGFFGPLPEETAA